MEQLPWPSSSPVVCNRAPCWALRYLPYTPSIFAVTSADMMQTSICLQMTPSYTWPVNGLMSSNPLRHTCQAWSMHCWYIQQWMPLNDLKLNDRKTEFIRSKHGSRITFLSSALVSIPYLHLRVLEILASSSTRHFPNLLIYLVSVRLHHSNYTMAGYGTSSLLRHLRP